MESLIFNLDDIIHFHSRYNTHIQINSICFSIDFGINCPTNSLFLHKKKNKKDKKEK